MSEPALEFRQLRAFVALADRGSVTAAAHALGLAQSTVSEALSALERALGAAVTVRRRRASEPLLTAAGHALLPHARGVLAAVKSAQVAVADATTAAHAVVNIVANESVSTYVLPDVLAGLRTRWPNARFAVSVATCPGVRAGVEDGTFHVGFLLATQAVPAGSGPSLQNPSGEMRTHSALRRVTVASDIPLVVFGAPAHPLAMPSTSSVVRRGVRRDRLADYPLFLSDAAGDFHAVVRDYFAADHVPGPPLEATGSVEGVKRGVAMDPRALGLLPLYALTEDLRAGRVAPVDLHPTPPRMRLDALLSRSPIHHPAVTELLDGVHAALAPRELGGAAPDESAGRGVHA